jgi:hypothetical protein
VEIRVKSLSLFPTKKNPGGHQGYRPIMPGQVGTPVSVLIGSVIIAAAILLSTLVTAVGTRFVGMEGSLEDSVWLIDRLTGNVYRCKATERGKAECDADTATGSIGDHPKP